MIATSLINNILLPIVLFFFYMTILMYLFYQFPDNNVSWNDRKITQQYDREIVITSSSKIDLESREIDRFLGKELARDPQRLRLKLTSLKFIDSLEHFSIYDLYRISSLLGLQFKSDSNEYKPIEKLKAEIKDIFSRDRSAVLAAMAQIKESNYA
ncbi:MAG: hypothetical protein ACFBSE_14165 [Prochloraceae cyanobacterium]